MEPSIKTGSRVARRPAQAKCHWRVQPRPAFCKSGWLGTAAPCEEAEAAASRYLLSAGTAQQATVHRLGWPPSVSLFPPSSKGSWGAVCVRARVENVCIHLLGRAPRSSAQMRRLGRGKGRYESQGQEIGAPRLLHVASGHQEVGA